jgi:RNA polymerase sigma-70 factor (ECF subfamily)
VSFILALYARIAESDAALAERIAAGDAEALRQVYERLAGKVRAIALRVLGRPAEADDVLQDTFLEVWRLAGVFDPARGSLSTWVATLAHRRSVDRLRRRGTRPLGEAAAGLPAATGDSPADPREDAAAREDRLRIQRALAALPPEQREAIELMYYGGLSQSEAATRLGLALGTLKSRVRAAMGRLGQVLGEPTGEGRS